ncbi:MAG: UDP-N-acetylmuramoylalanyl-D-glutamyl-2,6-diaminopimelate-D-alanyl-D-alanine ligase, partial [uncultured bacterium]
MLRTLLHSLLKFFSKRIIKKYHPDVIGITGSIGKSSAKEAIAAVLEKKFNIRKSQKNYNNEVGVPLTIIGVEKSPGRSILGWLEVFLKATNLLLIKNINYPEILVLEMGADKPGDIPYLVDIAPCKIGVLTYISHAHTEAFKTIKKIAQEKRVIISHLQRDGFAVLNFDNELVMQNSNTTKAEIATYGFKDGADFRATDVNIIVDEKTSWPTGLNFKLNFKGNIVPVFLPGTIA